MTITAPTLEDLSINDLQLDPHTQRSWDPKWSEEIKRKFDEDLLGVFRVSRRADGGLYVVDGQHRLHAVRDLGWEPDESFVQCLVWEGLTPEEEAELYVAFNVKTRKPNPVDTFRLEVVAGELEATEIQKVVEGHGLKVALGSGSNYVSAVAALRWIFQLGGPPLLDATFSLVDEAWGTKERYARDGNILRGVATVIGKLPQVDRGSLADKLGKNGKPGLLLGTARTYRVATKRSLPVEVAHQVVAIYNHGRRERRVSL